MTQKKKLQPSYDWLANWGGSIAVKVTAPVFWVLIPLGMTMAVIIQSQFANELDKNLKGDANHLAFVASRHLTNLEGGQPLELHRELNHHLQDMWFDYGEITVGMRRITFGNQEANTKGLEVLGRTVTYTNKLKDGDGLTAEMKLYHKPVKIIIKDYRRNLLLKFGAVFFLFGLGLTGLINMIVTRPIYELLSATKAVSDGDMSSRLVSNRTDEFGQLTEFFNEMLDKLQNKQEELSLAVKVAESASNAKSSFLANMSHEIRTPLTAILGFSNLLQGEGLRDFERQQHLDSIVHAGKHLQKIINDILDMSRIEAGQLKLENSDISIVKIVREVEELMTTKAREKNLLLKSRFHFPLPNRVKADATRIKQVLLNLCSNSIKFTQEGHIEIHVNYNKQDSNIELSVTDTGVGMSQEEIDRLFIPFSQGDTSTTREYGGTGLGLCICKELVTSMGGDILCQSRKGIGTRMTFTFSAGDIQHDQLVHSMDETTDEPRHPEVKIEPNSLSGKVLFAEDTPDNQRLVSMYIKRTGAIPVVVDNGKQALDMAITQEFDLVLMDIQMPVMGGVEATSRLRAAGYKKPIVAITANAMQDDQEKCLKAGVDDYLTKPLDVNHFNAVLKKYLPQRPVESQGASQAVSEDMAIDPFDEFRDDPEFQKLVKQFEDNLPEKITDITKAFVNKDWLELKNLVHKLKGTARNFGYGDLSDIASTIQMALVDQDYDQIQPLITNLNDCFKSRFPNFELPSNF